MICVPYWRVVVGSFKQIVRAPLVTESIRFQETFVAIQYITVNKFLIYFTGLSWMKNWPIYLRMMQRAKGMDPRALLPILRYFLIVLLSFVEKHSVLHFGLSSVMAGWDIYYCFSRKRLFERNRLLCYLRLVYHGVVGMNLLMRLWGMHSGVDAWLMVVVSKVLENYLRMRALYAPQSQNLIEAIFHMASIDCFHI